MMMYAIDPYIISCNIDVGATIIDFAPVTLGLMIDSCRHGSGPLPLWPLATLAIFANGISFL